MSSKGSQIKPVRFPEDILDAIHAQMRMTRFWSCPRRGEELVFSEWVRAACLEKLKKMKRSRRPR